MNDLKRVEFVITRACTGRCKHCSLGEPEDQASCVSINYAKLAGFLTRLAAVHPITSVMCFGGEPLLYPDAVFAIFEEAKRAGIPRRQLITNGFFSHRVDVIHNVARRCNEFSTEVLLSVDAFHQEHIPLGPVMEFARLLRHVKLHPAWLVSADHGNPYNLKTREILSRFDGMPISRGNVIFPRGNALKCLREYFPAELPQRSPYDQEPGHVTCISINPDGSIRAGGQIIGSAYEERGEFMLHIKLIVFGKLKEAHWKLAAEEYEKRLGAYCRLETIELSPAPLPEKPSPAEISRALLLEASAAQQKIKGACAALCVEGRQMSSEALGDWLAGQSGEVTFLIGSSYGLDESLKAKANLRLSLSEMTFAHPLARVMLLEQLYRALNRNHGGKYHK